MKKLVLVLAALCAVSYPAKADEAIIMGVGFSQCTQLTELYRVAKTPQQIENADFLVGSWASGFMSAANLFRQGSGTDTQNLASMSLKQQVIAMRRYCKHHPDDQVMRAVADLYQSMSSNVDGVKEAAR